MAWRSFVAIGDSFTEGMDDPYEDGRGYRGWADLVASRLAVAAGPDFGYANLAIRGRLFSRVVAEQVPPALEMKPDLVSFAAGGNDVLRRGFDAATFDREFDAVIGSLREVGADVLLFHWGDVGRGLPGQKMITARVDALNRTIAKTAERHGAFTVDLRHDQGFHAPASWSEDRLHLSASGHRRAAAHALDVLGLPTEPQWLAAVPAPERLSWTAARAADARWAARYLAPWLTRRLTGRSSGDVVGAKRPQLGPL